ncbi:MAG: hypothetical protein ACI8S2_000093, partial [Bacteroidia bacterium]
PHIPAENHYHKSLSIKHIPINGKLCVILRVFTLQVWKDEYAGCIFVLRNTNNYYKLISKTYQRSDDPLISMFLKKYYLLQRRFTRIILVRFS